MWVYRSEIISEDSTPPLPGAMVHVEDERGKFLGTALYSSSSQIATTLRSASPAGAR